MGPPGAEVSGRGGFDSTQVRAVGILPALHKRRIGAAVSRLVEWLGGRGLIALLPSEQATALSAGDRSLTAEEMADRADLLIAMGGDGTFLAAARLGAPRGKPIVGVNFGGFGFLAAVPGARMIEGLEEIMAGRAGVSERMLLEARVVRGGEEVARVLALNDVVVGRGPFSRLFRLRTSISGEPVSEFPADGMIVSTSTGSTGYSLSAGGPVVDPEVSVMVLTPICAHALTARTLIVPAEREVEISLPDPRGEEVNLTADGQEGFALRAGDRVRIRQAGCAARVLLPEAASFYGRLRGKLGWGAQR